MVHLRCIQNGQLRAIFMSTAAWFLSFERNPYSMCSQILDELPWVIGIVFSFKAKRQTSRSFILVALGPLVLFFFCLFRKQETSREDAISSH